MTDKAIKVVPETTFSTHGIRERSDLQRLLKQNIAVVDSDILVISEEFGEWEDSRRRIDLLGVDRDANLVVLELKRDDEGAHMELQAIRYAAMVRSMTFSRAVEVFEAYLRKGGTVEDAQARLLEFLQWDEPREDDFAQDVRIVLVAADFSKELTTVALWLNEHDIDVRCVRLKPYSMDGQLLIDTQQIVPLPEAGTYTVQIKQKEMAVRQEKAGRHQLRLEFWSELIPATKAETPRFSNLTPNDDHWLSAASGFSGCNYHYLIWKSATAVKLYIDRGSHSEKFNNAVFDYLSQNKSEIEMAFGKALVWDHVEGRRSNCIYAEIPDGGLRSPRDEWAQIRERLIKNMKRFEQALGPYLAKAVASMRQI